MQLVDEARNAWKWLSIQFSALGATAMAAWLALPEDSRKAVITWVADKAGVHDPVAAVALVAFISIIVGRLKKQGA